MCVRVFSVGFGPGLDSMSPARSRRSASHVAGTHGWLPPKTGRPGLRRGGVGGYNLHSVPPNSPPDCGTPTTSRLYPFGANADINQYHQMFLFVIPETTSLSICFSIGFSMGFSLDLSLYRSDERVARVQLSVMALDFSGE